MQAQKILTLEKLTSILQLTFHETRKLCTHLLSKTKATMKPGNCVNIYLQRGKQQ